MATGAMDSGDHGEAEGVSREKRSARREGGRPMVGRLGGKKGCVCCEAASQQPIPRNVKKPFGRDQC